MIFNMGALYRKDAAGFTFSYTGEYIESEITSNGVTYTLLTLIGNGTLTVHDVVADIWACGGGSVGDNDGDSGYGGAGAYCNTLLAAALDGEYVVTIGAGNGGNTAFGSLLTANGVKNSKSGGTGGGGYSYGYGDYTTTVSGGTGDKKSKYPFDDTVNFKCHCAGAGASKYSEWTADLGSFYYSGGNGGTNGGSGTSSKRESSSTAMKDGTGGDYGGGTPSVAGGNGTYYGAGASLTTSSAAAGVCYVRLPKSA